VNANLSPRHATGREGVPGDEGVRGEVEEGGLPVVGVGVGDQVVRQVLQKSSVLDTEDGMLRGLRAPVRFVHRLGKDRCQGAGSHANVHLQAVAAEDAAGRIGDLDFRHPGAVRVVGPHRSEANRSPRTVLSPRRSKERQSRPR